MCNLSVSDLLTCSLVSKRWNYEARSVLRDFRQCFARTDGKQPCTDLTRFESEIPRMIINPFTGLTINVQQYHRISGMCIGEDNKELLGVNYDFITNDLRLKYLKISLGWPNRDCHKCPAVQVILTILKRNARSLQEISFEKIPLDAQIYEPGDLSNEGSGLPNLKVLKFPHGYRMAHLAGNLVQDLILCAPNLEELHLESSADEIDFLPEERLRIVKSFIFKPRIASDVNFYQRFALSRPKLRHLTAWYANLGNLDEDLGWDALRSILLSSCDTLEQLRIDAIVAMMLTRMELPPLWNVHTLMVGVEMGSFTGTPILSALRNLNFNQMFPSLSAVFFYQLPGLRHVETEHFFDLPLHGNINNNNNNNIETGKMSRNIRHITLQECLATGSVQYWGTMFPHIVTLTGSTDRNNKIPYERIWRLWPNMQRIEVREKVFNPAYSLDSAFLGIYEQEVADLQRQTPEFLKAVHIVPLGPNITSLRGTNKSAVTVLMCRLSIHANDFLFCPTFSELCELRISLRSAHTGGNSFYLSKVTGYLAFRRMPRLRVTFLYENEETHRGKFFFTVCSFN